MKRLLRALKPRPQPLTFICQVFVMLLSVLGCTTPFHDQIGEQSRELTQYERRFVSLDYELLYRVRELPQSIADLLRQRVPGIANPGEPFNSTDLIVPSLPLTQLTWAGISGEFCFVLYKRGGFAPHQVLLLVELETNKVTKFQEFLVPYYTEDVDSLKHFVASGKARIPNEKR